MLLPVKAWGENVLGSNVASCNVTTCPVKREIINMRLGELEKACDEFVEVT